MASLTGLVTMGLCQTPNASRAVFDRRIAPILRSKHPSSCAECHLSGVDLKDYIRPTEAATFAALRDGGMIDLNRPDVSRLLKLIRMSRPKTPLVTQSARNAEYDAFRSWIVSAAQNPSLLALPETAAPSKARAENAVLRHARIDTVLASFERNIWSQQGRCMGCHTPGTPENTEHVKKYGERVKWFVPDSPEETMKRVLAQNLVDLKKPEESLLLLKPLNKVPHGGGVKFLYGDAGYKQFRAWIEDYAASIKGDYKTARDLPAPSTISLVYTNCILNIVETPESWGDRLLTVDIYAWDSAKGTWAAKPIATGDRGVWAKGRSTNVLVFLAVPPNSAEERSAKAKPDLVPGRYLLKYYCDTTGALDRDYRRPANSPEFYQGQQTITSDWSKGWGSPTKVAVKLEK
jgi:hypothetical protein